MSTLIVRGAAVRCAAATAIAVVALAAARGAQSPTQLGGAPNRRSVQASHPTEAPTAEAVRATSPIVVDGVLDEAAWQRARPITEFRQFDPDIGQPASERIEVRFLFDDEALYVGARLYDALGAAGVSTTVVRRDAFFNSDFFEVVIDGFHDHLSRAFFQVNPSGSKTDMIGIGASCCDSGWDPVWDAGTRIDHEGWTPNSASR